MSVERRDDILPPEEAPDASSKIFREYAAEFVELARNATSADQRFLYLKMANLWQETAIRWEWDLVKDRERVLRRSCRPIGWRLCTLRRANSLPLRKRGVIRLYAADHSFHGKTLSRLQIPAA
jgi:hypothetical protein